jgi:phosphopantothenoylcysteine synthetase/decarboxylase
MKVSVTRGPGFEPIDDVRRITNFSTGELGVRLCDTLVLAGYNVFCLKGSEATHPGPYAGCEVRLFDSDDDLFGRVEEISIDHQITAVFHVAALCDYRIRRIEDDQGKRCQSAKIASRSGALTISLEPATKSSAKCACCS